MTEQRFLAFDLGASGGRAIVGKLADKKIVLDEIHRFPNGDVTINGHMYWPILGLFRDIKAGLSAYAAKYGKDVTAVGIDTWGVDFVLMNRNDEMLGQAWNYRDSRTDGMLAKATTPVDIALGTNSRLETITIDELDIAKRYPNTRQLFRWPADESEAAIFQVYRVSR